MFPAAMLCATPDGYTGLRTTIACLSQYGEESLLPCRKTKAHHPHLRPGRYIWNSERAKQDERPAHVSRVCVRIYRLSGPVNEECYE